MEQVQIKDIKKGEFIRRKADSKTTFVRGDYVREEGWNRYIVSDYYNINRWVYLKGTTKVWVGFDF